MTVTVKVNETVIEVEPATPAKYVHELTVGQGVAVIHALTGRLDLAKMPHNDLTGARAAFYRGGTRIEGKPAVTKTETTYDIVGVSEDSLRTLAALLRRNYASWDIRPGSLTEAVLDFADDNF